VNGRRWRRSGRRNGAPERTLAGGSFLEVGYWKRTTPCGHWKGPLSVSAQRAAFSPERLQGLRTWPYRRRSGQSRGEQRALPEAQLFEELKGEQLKTKGDAIRREIERGMEEYNEQSWLEGQ